jgi:glucosamine 6-phosphate synthetase-like amidotransferase/phosphosugar isomerase protein
MSHDLRQDLRDLPRALRETLAKGRPEFDAIVRATRWGDGPIYMTGSGSAFYAVLTGAYAFQSLAGWPVVAHPAAYFEACTIPLLSPRSVVIVVSCLETDMTLTKIVGAAKSRGAVVLVLTGRPDDSVAQRADGVILLRPGEETERGFKTTVLQQTALSYLAFLGADLLKRHGQRLEGLGAEFEELPERAEWISGQLRDAARSVAGELATRRRCALAGGSAYYPAGLVGAFWLRETARFAAEGLDICEYQNAMGGRAHRDSSVVFLSSSRCRLKKQVHQVARAWVTSGETFLAITDASDQELAGRARMAIFLPTLGEVAGSILTEVLLGWVANFASVAGSHDKSNTLNPNEAS